MYIVSNRGVSADKIDEFEKMINLKLPEDYKDFLLHTNGGILNDDIGINISIPNTDIKFAMKKFYGISTEEDCLELVNRKVWEDLLEYENPKDSKEDLFQQSGLIEQSDSEFVSTLEYRPLVIGEDVLGQYVAINFVGDFSYVCYWDKDMKQSKSEDENAYYISNSFEEFVYIIEKNEKGDENMEKVNYLPLGSIVLMEGGIQKLIITSRGLVVQHNGEEVFFDYAAVPYPQGLISDDLLYFNHENIAKVVFEGYKDDDDEVIVGNINKFIENHPNMIKGDAQNW